MRAHVRAHVRLVQEEMIRFIFCLSLAILLAEGNQTKPNILLLFPDQWRFDWGGSYFDIPVRTPNFEQIAKQGTLFRQAVVASPLCAPSRSCLAAGREYDLAGVPSNFDNDYPINQTTFYTLLRGNCSSYVAESITLFRSSRLSCNGVRKR